MQKVSKKVKVNKLKSIIPQIKKILAVSPHIKLAYLFGSVASGATHAKSDLDLGIYIKHPDKIKRFEIRQKLYIKLALALKRDDIDIVIINDSQSTLLRYEIVSKGMRIFERQDYRVLVEPRIWEEYFFLYNQRLYNGTLELE